MAPVSRDRHVAGLRSTPVLHDLTSPETERSIALCSNDTDSDSDTDRTLAFRQAFRMETGSRDYDTDVGRLAAEEEEELDDDAPDDDEEEDIEDDEDDCSEYEERTDPDEDDVLGEDFDPRKLGKVHEDGMGYTHPDGREEQWYWRQYVHPDPEIGAVRNAGWTTINEGPYSSPSDSEGEASDYEPDPIFPIIDEKEIAEVAARMKDDIEMYELERGYAALSCTCLVAGNTVVRGTDEMPYFDHENGFWVDPASNDPMRTQTPFTVKMPIDNLNKKSKKAKADGNDNTDEEKKCSNIKTSTEITVPACDMHFPVTDVLEDSWKFTTGSRYIKQRLRLRASTPPPGDSSLYTSGGASSPSSSDVQDGHYDSYKHEAWRREAGAKHRVEGIAAGIAAGSNNNNTDSDPDHYYIDRSDVDSSSSSSSASAAASEAAAPGSEYSAGGHRYFTQHVDQAYQLRLIEQDPRYGSSGAASATATTHPRKMNIHAPPADWANPAHMARLNNWIYKFRMRLRADRRAAAATATATAVAESNHGGKGTTTSKAKKASPLKGTKVVKRFAWTAAEVDALRASMVAQLLQNGRYRIKPLVAGLARGWPDKPRSVSAVSMALMRYGLQAQARRIVEGGRAEQRADEAEEGVADEEDNDDELDRDVEMDGGDGGSGEDMDMSGEE